MDERVVDKPLLSRRKIIDRPRLTRLLDESPARIKLLVAPAGYGKTTLARQWLAGDGRVAYWTRCSSASSDIAALLAQIAATGPRQPSTLSRKLRRASHPAQAFESLMAALAADLSPWEANSWLVFDDYHELMRSPEAEEVVAEIADRTDANIFVTSRRRPSWVRARSLLYAEVFELDQMALAMTPDEISAIGVTENGNDGATAGAASGWPAFVSLAAGILPSSPASHQAQIDAYEFLISEILTMTAPETQSVLPAIALASGRHAELILRVHGRDVAERVIEDALAAGIFARTATGEVELHPLVAEAVRQEALRLGASQIRDVLAPVWDVLLADRAYDELYDLIVAARQPSLIADLLQVSVDALLTSGRTASIQRWVSHARDAGVAAPIVRIAEAQLAVRVGALGRARVIALEVATSEVIRASDRTVAWCIAGEAAHLQGDDAAAMKYFACAAELPSPPALLRRARWGRYISSLDVEHPGVETALAEITADDAHDPPALLERWSAQLLYEIRFGGLRSLREARAAIDVLDSVDDPLRRTGFRSVYTTALGLAGEYRRARVAAEAFLAEVQASDIEFAAPYARTALAVALLGLRDVDAATIEAHAAASEADRLDDAHALANAQALISRIEIQRGNFQAAYDAVMFELSPGLTKGMVGEVFGCRALALACLGSSDYEHSASRALERSRNFETRMLVSMANAVFASVSSTSSLKQAAQSAIDVAVCSGLWDLLVCAYRGHPEFLCALKDDVERQRIVRRVMKRAGDLELGVRVGLVSHGAERLALSPREREIHGLLALGLTNKQIAQRLFISEATAKLHVHHILEKLGVATRTAAAMRYVSPDVG